MKKFFYLSIAISLSICLISCGGRNTAKDMEIEQLRDSLESYKAFQLEKDTEIAQLLDSLESYKAIQLESERQQLQKNDGVHEWYVVFSDIAGKKYKEEFGCEIKNGEIVEANWYAYPKTAPMKGSISGDILKLRGEENSLFENFIEITMDMRTGRGTFSNPIVKNQEVKFIKN